MNKSCDKQRFSKDTFLMLFRSSAGRQTELIVPDFLLQKRFSKQPPLPNSRQKPWQISLAMLMFLCLVLLETYASSTLLDRLEFAWLLTQDGDGRLELTRNAFQVKEKAVLLFHLAGKQPCSSGRICK